MMKKRYEKPEIAFESFSLCTSIAGDCSAKAQNQADFHACGIYFDGEGTVFIEPWGGCVNKPLYDGGEYNGFCYDVPTEGMNLFNS